MTFAIFAMFPQKLTRIVDDDSVFSLQFNGFTFVGEGRNFCARDQIVLARHFDFNIFIAVIDFFARHFFAFINVAEPMRLELFRGSF